MKFCFIVVKEEYNLTQCNLLIVIFNNNGWIVRYKIFLKKKKFNLKPQNDENKSI